MLLITSTTSRVVPAQPTTQPTNQPAATGEIITYLLDVIKRGTLHEETKDYNKLTNNLKTHIYS